MLPSFHSLRERNLRTLYGDSKIISNYSAVDDKSPKGSVDVKIRPLVDLINRHPEYVTLSSCSGRVALFDPDGRSCDGIGGETGGGGTEEDAEEVGESGGDPDTDHPPLPKQNNEKGMTLSGKGRGKWIFVTHDILPDLGERIILSLYMAGQQRLSKNRPTTTEENTTIHEPPSTPFPITIIFKHEPPLLHVAASSLSSGRRLLRLAKSVCAMRESGLVVTDRRVTVELRTTGTALCLPLTVRARRPGGPLSGGELPRDAVSLVPGEDYLTMLAGLANERMVQNEALLDKLFASFRGEFFPGHATTNDALVDCSKIAAMKSDGGRGRDEYKVTMQPLPSLYLWKAAAVVIPRTVNIGANDLDVLAFGGQGIGPDIMGAVSSTRTPTCRRWDSVFRLGRRDGVWSNGWDTVSITSAQTPTKDVSGDHCHPMDSLATNAGIFGVQLSNSLGHREGHAACTLSPSRETFGVNRPSAVVIFGGRAGGPMLPSNDLFLFTLTENHATGEEAGALGRPADVRGALPEPRFGHSMTALHCNKNRSGWSSLHREEPIAAVAGGTGVPNSPGSPGSPGGVAVSLSSVYILSRVIDLGEIFSHLVWGRVSDMPSPRSYHAAVMPPREQNCNFMYVFGGVVDVSDPLDLFGNTNQEIKNDSSGWFALPLFGKDAVAQLGNDPKAALPPFIGSSAAAIPLGPYGVVLHVGGAKSAADSNLDSDACGPLNILAFQSDEGTEASELKLARISSIGPANEEANEGSSVDAVVDFGSCVHHCLVTLPKEESVESGDVTASAIIVGGGVPSFSFGQSYSR